jgi:biopolymer transport protein ExbD
MEAGQKGSSMASMNVVPLIDILLVLIIIFMVITPLTPKGLDAQIPQPTKADRPAPPQTLIVVQIGDSGSLKINEEDATWDSLGGRLSDVFKERAEKVAFVQGGDSVRFSEIAHAIDIMRSSGIDKVGLILVVRGVLIRKAPQRALKSLFAAPYGTCRRVKRINLGS